MAQHMNITVEIGGAQSTTAFFPPGSTIATVIAANLGLPNRGTGSYLINGVVQATNTPLVDKDVVSYSPKSGAQAR